MQGAERARAREAYRREVHQANSSRAPPPPAPSPPIAPSDVEEEEEEEDLAVEFHNEALQWPHMQAGILASLESFAAEELRQARLARLFTVKLEADTAEAIRHSLQNDDAAVLAETRRRTLG